MTKDLLQSARTTKNNPEWSSPEQKAESEMKKHKGKQNRVNNIHTVNFFKLI